MRIISALVFTQWFGCVFPDEFEFGQIYNVKSTKEKLNGNANTLQSLQAAIQLRRKLFSLSEKNLRKQSTTDKKFHETQQRNVIFKRTKFRNEDSSSESDDKDGENRERTKLIVN